MFQMNPLDTVFVNNKEKKREIINPVETIGLFWDEKYGMLPQDDAI